MKTIFVADAFSDHIARGAELNDEALINYIDPTIERIGSKDLHQVDPKAFYIIGNFVLLDQQVKDEFVHFGNYLIYEHDHKYVASRNPFIVPHGNGYRLNETAKVPDEHVINRDFYENAKVVICLTDWHQSQLEMNLNCKEITNIHGSIWTAEDLDLLESMSETKKRDRFAIYSGANVQTQFSDGGNLKNTPEAIQYCVDNNHKYTLIPRMSSRSNFLKTMAKHSDFVFFPRIPETCSRILVEAKMLGMNVHTNDNSGAYHEEWWGLDGKDLINHFRNTIIPRATDLFKGYINERNSNSNPQ